MPAILWLEGRCSAKPRLGIRALTAAAQRRNFTGLPPSHLWHDARVARRFDRFLFNSGRTDLEKRFGPTAYPSKSKALSHLRGLPQSRFAA